MSAPLIVSALWSIILLIAFLIIAHHKLPALSFIRNWKIVLAVAVAARLVPMLILPMGAGFDIQSYQIVGELIRNGADVYSSALVEGRYPYLPLFLYWTALTQHWTALSGWPFPVVVKVLPVACDIAIVLLLYYMLGKQPDGRPAQIRAALLYAVNPLPVFVSAYHGQFDALSVLSILSALHVLQTSALGAGSWLALGILAKSWPVLALPSMLAALAAKHQIRLILGIAMVSIPAILVYSFSFQANPEHIVQQAMGYNHGVGVWGYTYGANIVRIAWDFSMPYSLIWHYGRFVTLFVLAIIWWFWGRHMAPAAGVLTTLVAFLAVTHAFSIQYLMWPVALAILIKDLRWLYWYTITAYFYMFVAYNTLILEMHITKIVPWPQADWLIIIPASLPVWIVTILWLRHRLANASTYSSSISAGVVLATNRKETPKACEG